MDSQASGQNVCLTNNKESSQVFINAVKEVIDAKG